MGTARNIELYSVAYRLALKQISTLQMLEQPNIALHLHASIQRQIETGATEPLFIASEALRDIEKPITQGNQPRRKRARIARLNVQHLREIRMLARPTLKKPPEKDQDDLSSPKGQARPIDKRFLLRVDGQVKTSFDAKEHATTAGAAIKKAFPIVVVTVVDTERSTTETISSH